jgi:hypothetical protein
VVAAAALVSWVLNVLVGLTMVRRWPRTPVVLTHLAVMFVGVGTWVVYLAGDRPTWQAFLGLVVLAVGNGFGDVLLVRSYRRRGGTATGADAYVAAAGDVLTLKQLPTVHAGLAGVTFVLVILTVLGL